MKETLGRIILYKYNTNAWRKGQLPKQRNWNQLQPILEKLMTSELKEQAKQLEQEGFIEITWKNVNTEIESFYVNVERLDELYMREQISNPRYVFHERRTLICEYQSQVNENWAVKFFEKVLSQIEKKKKELPKYAQDELFLTCIKNMGMLTIDMWENEFSAKYLGDSKLFKSKYRERVITILKEYSDQVEETMEDSEILAEHKIFTYSQTLEGKGTFLYNIITPTDLAEIDTGNFLYGFVLNAQTLEHSTPIDANEIKKVVTIENKANYEKMEYQEGTLYLYTHGFFSPKERKFLKQLEQLFSKEVEFYHWSDMDYGGFRIFNFIKKKVFINRTIIPYKMNADCYYEALAMGKGLDLTDSCRKSLENMQISELEQLKQCILKEGKTIEQELLL